MSILLDYLQKKAKGKKITELEYLKKAAELAKGCVLCTHIGKFTHPDVSGINAFVAYNPRADGYVCTQNTECKLDAAVSSASYATISGLLSLELEDGRSFYEHLENNDQDVIADIESVGGNFTDFRKAFLEAKRSTAFHKSDTHLKQVFFPVNDEYHLLSIMSPSSLAIKVRNKLRPMEKNDVEAHIGKLDADEYRLIPNTGVIKIGGTNVQNISPLNSRCMGEMRMFPCFPPQLKRRNVRYPTRDFFSDTLFFRHFRSLFLDVHKCYTDHRNNIVARQAVKDAELSVFEEVLLLANELQSLPKGWTRNRDLPDSQKAWLDSGDEDWRPEIAERGARWFIFAYRKILNEDAIPLSDTEFSNLRELFLSIL